MSDPVIPITKPIVRPAPQPVPAKQESAFPSEVINLPSKGWFYPPENPLSTGQLELKPMTAREEDILNSRNLVQKGIVLDKLLESLIIEKAINPNEMLNCDRNAAFLAIRRMAYGDEYRANLTCPKCGRENEVNIDLGKMDNKPFEFEKFPKGKNEFDFTLPLSKKPITFKLLTKKDEDGIESELKALQKVTTEVTSEITTRLKFLLTSVEGNREKGLIRKFADEMRAGDSLALRRHMRDFIPDVDMTFNFECRNGCPERREIVPVDVSFFWPNR